MSKVTSKLQVTIPKVIAEAYGIAPGAEILFEPCGEAIRVRRPGGPEQGRGLDIASRLRLFDEAMARVVARAEQAKAAGTIGAVDQGRGWSREELYDDRGLPR